MRRRHGGMDASAHREVADDGHLARVERRHEIVEDPVSHLPSHIEMKVTGTEATTMAMR